MKYTQGKYEYRTTQLDGGSEKYGLCELTGEKSGDMVMIATARHYHRPDGTSGKAHFSNIYCSKSAAAEYIKTAPSEDTLQSAFAEESRIPNLAH